MLISPTRDLLSLKPVMEFCLSFNNFLFADWLGENLALVKMSGSKKSSSSFRIFIVRLIKADVYSSTNQIVIIKTLTVVVLYGQVGIWIVWRHGRRLRHHQRLSIQCVCLFQFKRVSLSQRNLLVVLCSGFYSLFVL